MKLIAIFKRLKLDGPDVKDITILYEDGGRVSGSLEEDGFILCSSAPNGDRGTDIIPDKNGRKGK